MAQRASPDGNRNASSSSGQLVGDIYILLVAIAVLAVPLGAFWGAFVTFREAGLLGVVPLVAALVVLGAAYYSIRSLANESALLRRIVSRNRR